MAKPCFELVEGVHVVRLDDEAVVFNPLSWETHVLNAAATLVLERLQAGACAMADIAPLLEEVLEEGEGFQAKEHAERVLSDLASLRLIIERPGLPHEGS